MNEIESIFLGRTFDDFLIPPQFGVLEKRNCSLAMPLTNKITLKGLPVIAANMDTVTEAEMMKAVSLEGAFAFLHRNCPVEKQVQMAREVQRYHGSAVDEPLVLPQNCSIKTARKLSAERKISGILIEASEGSKKLVGILSKRDMPESGNDGEEIAKFMTHENLLTAKSGISIEEAEKLMLERKVEKLPLLNGKGEITGLITMKDLRLAKQRPNATKDRSGRLLVGAAVGATVDRWGVNYLERAAELIKNGVKCILIDLAHYHSVNGKKATIELRKKFSDVQLIGGNIATAKAALDAYEWGVDAVKVGIGPGFGCRTRIETNFGVAQLEAIRRVYLALEGKIPLIADGGIKRDGAIFLAIAAGASTVMLGSELAGTDESPGTLIEDPVRGKIKIYRGSTSPQSVISSLDDDEEIADALMTPAEGQEAKIPYKGKVTGILRRIAGHLRSAVSYSGQKDLFTAHQEISQNAGKYFSAWLSRAAQRESFER